jgi:putative ABC transport system permease protein
VIIATLLMALRELRRNLMRSTLTALGIVIGVGAVIGMVTFGNGATEKVRADVAKMGNNMLQVSVGSNRRGGPAGSLAPNFTMTDVNAVRREVTAASMVAPSVGRSQLTVYGNKNRSTSTTGTTNEFFEIRGYTLTSGRFSTTPSCRAAWPCA